MAMGASRPAIGSTDRLAELQRENEELREQLRQYAAQATVARGAIREAVHEKEATAKIAHQVAVEEQATRTAVEVQGSNIGMAVVMNILNFFLLLVLAVGLFAWLPREIENRVGARSSTVVTTPGSTVIPR
jgi:hypothetical protein